MTAPIKDANFYADFGSLSALKRDARAEDPKALRAAAQQFESLFTDMMLKSMRQASIGDSMTGSDTLDMYQGMFDQQLSSQMSKGRGIGLADMLVQQLSRTGLSKAPAADTTNAVEGAAAPVGRVSHPTSSISQPTAISDESAEASDSAAAAKPDQQTSTWPPASREEFVQRMLPHAQAAAEKLGVDPETLVAHAALETGWGKHIPSNADGSSSFNLFGIKATPKWNGDSTASATLEYQQGVAVKRVERFKSYESPEECFADYAKLLGNSERYSNARNSGGNDGQFAQSLQQGGYATDPHYANKLRAVTGAVRAMQVDNVQVAPQVAPQLDKAAAIQVAAMLAAT